MDLQYKVQKKSFLKLEKFKNDQIAQKIKNTKKDRKDQKLSI